MRRRALTPSVLSCIDAVLGSVIETGQTVAEYSRRTFVGGSVAGLTAVALPTGLHAAAQCVAGPLPGFQPTWLSVDCASKRNFQTFRRNPDALGLAGVVSMSFVR